jgi:hypothetical protein
MSDFIGHKRGTRAPEVVETSREASGFLTGEDLLEDLRRLGRMPTEQPLEVGQAHRQLPFDSLEVQGGNLPEALRPGQLALEYPLALLPRLGRCKCS